MKKSILMGAAAAAGAVPYLGERHLGARFFHAPFDVRNDGGRIRFLDKDNGGGSGGGNDPDPAKMTDSEFRGAVLGGVKSLKAQNEELITNYDNLDKETKKAFEELTKLKNEFASISEKTLAMQKLSMALKNERRSAFGDPARRILNDETKAREFLGLIALAAKATPEQIAKITGKALGQSASPGSTMVDSVVVDDVYDTLLSYGSYNTLDVRNVSTKTNKLLIKTARPVAKVLLRGAGAKLGDDANKAGTSVDLIAEIIGVLLEVDIDLLEDAVIDLAADIINDFAEAMAFRLDYLAFMANGTANDTDGGMTGLFNFGTGVAAIATHTTVEKTDYLDWLKCLTGVDPAVLSRPARWWIHPTILAAALGVKDANGRPIFLTALEAPSQGAIGSILGYPVSGVGVAPSTNAASQKLAAFGDPKAMCVGIRKGFEFAQSDEAAFDEYQRVFRGIGRAGVKGRRATAVTVLSTPAA